MIYNDISDDEFKNIIKNNTNWENICKVFNTKYIVNDILIKINRLKIDYSHIQESYIEYNKNIKDEVMGHISEEKFIEIVKNAKNWDDVIIGCNLKTLTRSLQRRLKKIDHSHLPKNFGGIYSKLGKFSKEYYKELVKKSKSWDEILLTLKYNSTLFLNTIKGYFDQYDINYSHLTYPEKLTNKMKIELKDILVENSMYNSGTHLKKRLLEELNWKYKCAHCGLSTYSNFNVTNVPIPLEVEHINGIHSDNRIQNLCLLCPNCHALTDTYKGKNMAIAKQNKENPKQKEIKPKQDFKKPFSQKCIDCNKDIVRRIPRCINCNIKFTFPKYLEKYPTIPSYDQLKIDLDELHHYTLISKKYNISSNVISEIFYKYRIVNNEIVEEENINEIIEEQDENVNEDKEEIFNEIIEDKEEIFNEIIEDKKEIVNEIIENVNEIIEDKEEFVNEIIEDQEEFDNKIIEEQKELNVKKEDSNPPTPLIIANNDKKCLDCDNIIYRTSIRCITCNDKHKFIESSKNHPSYEQLKKDIEELKYYKAVGRKYNVSDNAIRKWMTKYEKYNL